MTKVFWRTTLLVQASGAERPHWLFLDGSGNHTQEVWSRVWTDREYSFHDEPYESPRQTRAIHSSGFGEAALKRKSERGIVDWYYIPVNPHPGG